MPRPVQFMRSMNAQPSGSTVGHVHASVKPCTILHQPPSLIGAYRYCCCSGEYRGLGTLDRYTGTTCIGYE